MSELNVEKSQKGKGEVGAPARSTEFPSSLLHSPFDLLTANPFTLMRRFSEEMDRAFSGSWQGSPKEGMMTWSPALDISQRDGKMIVHADLPGLTKDDVKVEAANDGLIIRGERKREHKEEGKGFYRSECSYGSFYRAIPLPTGAKAEEAHAEFNNGVLEVSIPVPEQQHGRRQIPVGSGSGMKKEVGSSAETPQRKAN